MFSVNNPNRRSQQAPITQIIHWLIATVLVAAITLTSPASTTAQDLTAGRVRSSIERAKQFLLDEQNNDGSWRNSDKAHHPEGVTALVTLALLNAGVSPKNDQLEKAIRRISELPQSRLSTYVAGLRLMVLASADPKGQKYRDIMRRDVNWLQENQIKTGAAVGGWAYPYAGSGDGSNTQYALLGLHEASKVGIEVDREVWQRALAYWSKSFRSSTGGFGYGVNQKRINGAMTCAGIASTIICEENLADAEQFLENGEVACCRPNANSEMIEKGLAWMAKRFAVRGNPTPGRSVRRLAQFYYLYGMERAGRLSGRRFIGDHDWYREGAKELLAIQKTNGSWVGAGGFSEDNANISTSFSLLFLAKGKRPIAIGKYKFGPGNDWDRHPWGVHYLTRELESQWNTKLNWQTINGETATVQDLAETPVLFISGRDQLDLTSAQKRALKEYIENGNFIFAEAGQGNGCGDNVKFDRKFRALMEELFPETPMQALSLDHPIWNSYFEINAKANWPVLGLQACCRTSVVYCPRSLSGHWQLNRKSILENLPRTPKTEIDYATQLGVNVVSYATGRQLRDKLDSPQIASATVSVLDNRALVLPKLSHKGGSDDAPNAWRNILRRAGELGLTVDTKKQLVLPNSDQLLDYPFVFMHGRHPFFFKKQEIDVLANYLKGGNRGFIFADSICSSNVFNKSFEQQIAKILPGQNLEPIPADHPMWTDRFGGFNIKTVTITKPDRDKPEGFAHRTVAPQFLGVQINERYVVVYSPLDLSCALENATLSHCEGYTRDDALKLAINVLMYRLQRD